MSVVFPLSLSVCDPLRCKQKLVLLQRNGIAYHKDFPFKEGLCKNDIYDLQDKPCTSCKIVLNTTFSLHHKQSFSS